MKNISKWLKRLLLVIFVLVVVALGVYRFPLQSVTVTAETDVGTFSETYTPQDIAAMPKEGVRVVQVQGAKSIREIRLYRKFKTLCIDKITSGALPAYGWIAEDGIYLNAEGVEILDDNSSSFMMERFFYAEIALAVFLLLRILVNAWAEKADPNNYDNHGPIYEIKKFIGELRKYAQYMNYAAKADLKAEVANSYLNRLWWLLEPFFNMLVYVIVFGQVMGSSIENYATFVFSALLMWNFFGKVVNYSVRCVRANKDIISKIYVPKHVLMITDMILDFYKLLFSLIVLVPMLFIFHVHLGINIFWIIPAYIVMIVSSFAVGTILLHYGVYIDDLGYAVSILLSMLMFMSGTFYDVITGLPKPLNAMMLVLNPVSMYMDTMRNALLYNLVSNVPLLVLWTVLSLLVGYIGMHTIYKNENSYVKII